MRAAGWLVTGLGVLVGTCIVAYAVLIADYADSPMASARGDQIRTLLVGVTVVTVGLAIGGALRHRARWTHYVFVALGAMLAIAALWWALRELLG